MLHVDVFIDLNFSIVGRTVRSITQIIEEKRFKIKK